MRLNEARDVSDQGNVVDRYRLNDHVKDMLATPPNTLRINEKYISEYYILNRVGVVITTNYRDALWSLSSAAISPSTSATTPPSP